MVRRWGATHCGKKITGLGTVYYWRGPLATSTLEEFTIQEDDPGNFDGSRRCSKPREGWMELWCMSCAQKYGIVW